MVTMPSRFHLATRKKVTSPNLKKITSLKRALPLKDSRKNFATLLSKNIGNTITVDIFAEGDKVEVIGTTKGRGFQGVVKRHGFHGVGQQSHGQHDRQRAPGSLGNSSDAARVMKGMKMAGRMGSDRVKLKGLKVVKIFADKNYILVSGSVPGHNGSIVLIQK
jgi:large subunit ribosomal protein L3